MWGVTMHYFTVHCLLYVCDIVGPVAGLLLTCQFSSFALQLISLFPLQNAEECFGDLCMGKKDNGILPLSYTAKILPEMQAKSLVRTLHMWLTCALLTCEKNPLSVLLGSV